MMRRVVVEKLGGTFMERIRDHFLDGPPSHDKVLECLNALAITAATVMHGVGDDRDQALAFFIRAINDQLTMLEADKARDEGRRQ